jgi:amino acid transporter
MKATSAKLGTFGGVFTPSILTILGLILFLRLDFVVGKGGAMRALAILALATTISSLTSVSLAAIATNRRVRGGGDYYLISRSLGVAYGGALGLILFVAQAVSVGFYCVGFAEGISGLLPATSAPRGDLVAASAAALLMVLAYLGADLATRFQYVIMAILGAALASFFVGATGSFDGATLAANWRPGSDALGFWALFAIFFPAVTGFTQGVSMSGDLRDPARSLPTGTFLAVGLSTLVYAAVALLLGGALPASELAAGGTAMKRAAAVPWLVSGGILAATLSSALASFLGAPRILQALSADRIFPRLAFFAAGHGPAGNPRRAVLLTGAIALVTINLGNLNAIAGVVSMFFLISYGLLNYATYVEATAASPSFRPRFRFFHARASLLGTLLCAGVMLALDPVSGVVAVALIAAIYQYVNRTAVPAHWRDSLRAYRFRRVKEGLRAIAAEPAGATDWQPQVLAFTHGLERRSRVLRFAAWITGGSGIVTAASLIEGEGASEQSRQRCRELEAELRLEIEEHALDIYPLVIAAPDLRTAMTTLVQSWGLGPIRSNTVLLNWMSVEPSEENSSAALWYGRMIANAVRLRQHVVVLDTDETAWVRLEEIEPDRRRIDVWWFEDESSRLSLLLAHLVTRTEDWEDAHLRILATTGEGESDRMQAELSRRLEEYRIDAQVTVLSDPDLEGVIAHSRDAALVLMPLRIEGMRLADAFGWGIDAVLARLPIVALVAAADDVRLTEERDEPVPPARADGAPPEGSPESDGSDVGAAT